MTPPPLKRQPRLLALGSHMPPCQHNLDAPTSSSEVFDWLSKQPSVLQYVFDDLRDAKAIVYDVESETWVGCSTNEDTGK